MSYLRVEEIKLFFEVLQWCLIGVLTAKVLLASALINFFYEFSDNLKLAKARREIIWPRQLSGLVLDFDLEHLTVETERGSIAFTLRDVNAHNTVLGSAGIALIEILLLMFLLLT